MTTIVNNIPATTPVAILNLGNNKMTKIPAKLPQYAQLQTLIVSNNAIATVNAKEVTLLANVAYLDFSGNKITKIAAGSLPGT